MTDETTTEEPATRKRRKRHKPDEIVRKLRDADAMLNAGKDLAAVLQKLEVSEATYHRWRQQFGGMKAEEAKRLKELEQENARLKRLLADAELDKSMLKELLEGNCRVKILPASASGPFPKARGGRPPSGDSQSESASGL